MQRISFGRPDAPPNRLYLGDNLDTMRALPAEQAALLYADPPFFTNRTQRGRDGLSFADSWETIDQYIDWMRPRLVELHRLLSPQGSLYVHLDWRAVHYVKVELDRIFGMEHFRNEIIWKYQMAGRSARYFPRKHDTILFYTKSDGYYFDSEAVREPYSPHARDPRQARYGGQMGVDEQGRAYVEKLGTGGKRRYRYYLDRGKLAGDVWELEALHPSAHERTGYPTQKPEVLLSRIIRASCPPGGLCGDFFAGSGTSLVTAAKEGRRFIGGDLSPQALQVAIERLRALSPAPPDVELFGTP
jgi:DNA modification methylase